MDLSSINSAFEWIGNTVSFWTQKTISYISQFGVNISQTQSKIINLLLILGFLYLIIKVISIPKTMLKYGIITLLIVLGISVILSLI